MPNTGFLGWAYISGSAVSFSSGVADRQVLFMSGSDIASGSSAFQYNYTTDTLSVDTINVVSEIGGDFDIPGAPTFSGTPTFNGSAVFETDVTVSGSIVQGVGSTEIANVFVTDSTLLQSAGTLFSGDLLDPHPFAGLSLLQGYVHYFGAPFTGIAPLTASVTGSGAENFLVIPVSSDIGGGALVKGFFNYETLGVSAKNALLSSSSGTGSLDAYKQIFADPARPGGITTVAPTTSGHVVRCLGHAISTGSIYFNPSPDFIEI